MRKFFVKSGQIQPHPVHPLVQEISAANALMRAGAEADVLDAYWKGILESIDAERVPGALRPQLLVDGAGVYIRLYEMVFDEKFLERAIVLLDDQSVSRTDDFDVSSLAASYRGVAFGYRSDLNGSVKDLQRAAEETARSVEGLLETDWRAPIFALNIGLQTFRSYDLTASFDLLVGAIEILEEAAKSRVGSAVYMSAAECLADLNLERYCWTLEAPYLAASLRWSRIVEE